MIGNQSPADSPLMDAISRWVEANDSGAETVPVILPGFSDSRWFREAFPECVAYGFFPQRHMTVLDSTPLVHNADERIDVRDLGFAAGSTRTSRASCSGRRGRPSGRVGCGGAEGPERRVRAGRGTGPGGRGPGGAGRAGVRAGTRATRREPARAPDNAANSTVPSLPCPHKRLQDSYVAKAEARSRVWHVIRRADLATRLRRARNG